MDGIWLFVFITKYIDINLILLLNFIVLLGGYWEFNSRVIQLIDVFFVRFFNPLRIFILWVQTPDVAPSEALIILIFHVDQSLCTVSEFLWKFNI